jgi:hypothetical protein
VHESPGVGSTFSADSRLPAAGPDGPARRAAPI